MEFTKIGRRKVPVLPIHEEVVKTVARIMGEQSACADALRNAEERRAAGEHVEFFTAGDYVLVRGVSKLPK